MRCPWLVVSALLLFTGLSFSQISDKVSRITIGKFRSGEPLSVQVEIARTAAVDRIDIAYRAFGLIEFKRVELSTLGDVASGTIPAGDLNPPFLEYYFLLHLKNTDSTETYPLENPELHPLRAALTQSASVSNISIHTPEWNEQVKPEDVLISFSLLDRDTTVNTHATKIFLDAADVSSFAIVSGNLYVLQPENASMTLSTGSHTIRVELYNKQGESIGSDTWSFTVVSAEEETFPAAAATPRWVHTGTVQLETRNENIASSSTSYNRGNLSASSSYERFRFNGRMYLTNEENNDRQPQHRFFIGAESPWVNIGLGDLYPAFPDLIMNGKRVRGFAGNLTLGFFNLAITKGETVRRIESTVEKTFPQDSLSAEQQRNPSSTFGLYNPKDSTWAIYKTVGTFSRDLFVIRPSFGKEEQSHVGFTYLKSKDDVNSIRYGFRPQENLVLGSDILITLDNHRAEIRGQGAFSATNRDISKGTFTDADINSIFNDSSYSSSYRNDIRRTRDVLSRFITVNENLVPLSLKNLSTLSYETGVSLNYFNNNFRWTYLRHGNDYQSFGQTFLRTDVAGYVLSDRLGLVSNQVFISGGVERLHDNTAETKAATTTYTTTNVAVSYFPRRDFPNITVAYLHANNDNKIGNIPPQHVDSLYAVHDNTDRFVIQSGYVFTYGPRHNASVSFGTSTRDDQSPKNLDSKSTTFMLSDLMTYQFPLQTTLSVTTNANELSIGGTTKINYTTLYGNAQYRMMEGKLSISGTLSPTFGDIERTLLELGAQYFFMKNISAQTLLNLYFNKQGGNDTIWGFIIRIDV